MEKRRDWNIGEPCFIADVRLTFGYARVRILNARVYRPSDATGRGALARSITADEVGPIYHEDEPFATEEDIRAYFKNYAAQAQTAFDKAWLSGRAPRFELPSDMPNLGNIVYTFDPETCEILEVEVGSVQMDHVSLEVGYDPSPGNSEVSMVRMSRWWHTRAQAEEYTRKEYPDAVIGFRSKEEVRARADRENAEAWQKIDKRLTASRQ